MLILKDGYTTMEKECDFVREGELDLETFVISFVFFVFLYLLFDGNGNQ